MDYESIRPVADLVRKKTAENGKFAGIFTKDPAEVKMYRDMGFQFIIVSSDISCLVSGCRQIGDKILGGGRDRE